MSAWRLAPTIIVLYIYDNKIDVGDFFWQQRASGVCYLKTEVFDIAYSKLQGNYW